VLREEAGNSLAVFIPGDVPRNEFLFEVYTRKLTYRG